VWDARTFQQRREIRSYGIVNSTAFSRDGRFLVTAGDGASIWETATGARLQVLPNHGNLFAVSTTADGRKSAVAGKDGFVAMFECEVCVPIEGLLQLAAKRSPRHLTAQERSDFLSAP
jgi:WD40 repeat protein